jgi:hypothetical protein
MKPVLVALLVAFGAYTSYAMLEVGYLGIWAAGFASVGSLQVLLDLVISCVLIASWMVIDAREKGRNPWPYLAITVLAGSFGPLLYLILADRRAVAAAHAPQRA